jgi:predicted rRNA methylase YqxC with S4 and FtsJ domains
MFNWAKDQFFQSKDNIGMYWSDKKVVLEAVKQNGCSLEYASEELKNDKEVVWTSMGYFKLIKSIKTFDLNFKF